MLTAQNSRASSDELHDNEDQLGTVPNPTPCHLTVTAPVSVDTSLKGIFKDVCERHRLDPKLIAMDVRQHSICRARWEFCWRARQVMRLTEAGKLENRFSLPFIGQFLVRYGRPEPMDHTAVLNAVRQYQKLVDAGEVTA